MIEIRKGEITDLQRALEENFTGVFKVISAINFAITLSGQYTENTEYMDFFIANGNAYLEIEEWIDALPEEQRSEVLFNLERLDEIIGKETGK